MPIDWIGRDSSKLQARSRLAFLCTAALAGALFWIAPRPPMGDLPQHAAQISLLHDLLLGQSPWADLVHINYFTPYWLPYGLATLLSFAMPVLTALKLILTLAFYAFLWASIRLREELGSDERLDWLLIPGFFGFAFQYGFYTFLVAAPLGLIFILLAKRFARTPTRGGALRMTLVGAVLFFSHGLVFLFAAGIGFGMVLIAGKRSLNVWALLPYALLGALTIAYYLVTRFHDPLISAGDSPLDWQWLAYKGWHRAFTFPVYSLASTLHDPGFLAATLCLLATPWLLGAKINREPAALLPLAATIVIWFAAPAAALKTSYLYHRFALFLLPSYAFAFRAPEISNERIAAKWPRALAAQAFLILLCWIFLGTVAVREHRFEKESAGFEDILAAAEPGARALEIAFDPGSAAVLHEWAYNSYALWYQAERRGFVDFNFAYFLPEVVRFRTDRLPAFANGLELFQQHKLDTSPYRYLFVRHLAPLPANLFADSSCAIAPVRESADWSLFERRCR